MKQNVIKISLSVPKITIAKKDLFIMDGIKK